MRTPPRSKSCRFGRRRRHITFQKALEDEREHLVDERQEALKKVVFRLHDGRQQRQSAVRSPRCLAPPRITTATARAVRVVCRAGCRPGRAAAHAHRRTLHPCRYSRASRWRRVQVRRTDHRCRPCFRRAEDGAVRTVQEPDRVVLHVGDVEVPRSLSAENVRRRPRRGCRCSSRFVPGGEKTNSFTNFPSLVVAWTRSAIGPRHTRSRPVRCPPSDATGTPSAAWCPPIGGRRG